MAAMLSILSPSGDILEQIPSVDKEWIIGRSFGPLFEHDPFLSPRHVHIECLPSGRFRVTDQQSFNGTYLRIEGRERLEDQAVIRIGKQCLRFSRLNPWFGNAVKPWISGVSSTGAWGRLAMVVGPNLDGSAALLCQATVRLGRTIGEIRFPQDEYVSGHHASLHYTQGQVYLEDASSRNGTFLRINQPRILGDGSMLIAGQRLLRVDADPK